MGMGFAPTWRRQVSHPASQNHFNHCGSGGPNLIIDVFKCHSLRWTV